MKFLFFTLLVLPLSILSQDRQAKIERLMSDANIPGLSLAYVKEGKIRELYELGIRNVDTGKPVDSATIFAAASLSKCVFAYGVMKLVESGRLSLDTALYVYLDYSDLKHDERYKKITARMILSHTSGLPNWRNGSTLNFRYNPGERYSYSGEGFVLLSRVVEKITGRPIADWMQEEVFIPLKMYRTSYIWKKEFDNNYAQPHTRKGQKAGHYSPKQANMAHSLQTTAIDYGKFLSALLNGKDLKDSTWRSMFMPQVHSQFEKYESQLAWGLGVGLEQAQYGTAFWQWGDNETFKAFLIGYPAKNEGLVYFTNSYNGLSIAQELISLFFPGTHPSVKWLGW